MSFNLRVKPMRGVLIAICAVMMLAACSSPATKTAFPAAQRRIDKLISSAPSDSDGSDSPAACPFGDEQTFLQNPHVSSLPPPVSLTFTVNPQRNTWGATPYVQCQAEGNGQSFTVDVFKNLNPSSYAYQYGAPYPHGPFAFSQGDIYSSCTTDDTITDLDPSGWSAIPPGSPPAGSWPSG